jgi:hypothetical protein
MVSRGRSDVSLPQGTVTFLFTDIEGSTRLLQECGDEYAAMLAGHHQALRGEFERHGGVEVSTQGDAFFVAFAKASDALAAAAAACDALADGPIRVRMGLHTGEPTSPVTTTSESMCIAPRVLPPPVTAVRFCSRRRRATLCDPTACATSACIGLRTLPRLSTSTSSARMSFRR